MKKAVFAFAISFGLALPAAVASADQITDSWQRDLDRSLAHSPMAVTAEREASYADFRFVDDSQVATSYIRDLERAMSNSHVEVQLAREASYADFFNSDPIRASYIRDIDRSFNTVQRGIEAKRVCSYSNWVDGHGSQC